MTDAAGGFAFLLATVVALGTVTPSPLAVAFGGPLSRELDGRLEKAGRSATDPVLPESPQRGVVDGWFVSESEPRLRARIDDRFSYLGRDRFVLRQVALVDRHHWVAVRDGRVEAMIVLQFEGFLDGVEDEYRYRIPGENSRAGSNYRFSARPIVLGGAEYIHNTWAYDNAQGVLESPGAEADRTRRFLAERGYHLDDHRIMSRFVRVVGDERRKELIIFYIEPLAAHNLSIEGLPDGGPASEDFDRLSEAITRLALSSFEILEPGR